MMTIKKSQLSRIHVQKADALKTKKNRRKIFFFIKLLLVNGTKREFFFPKKKMNKLPPPPPPPARAASAPQWNAYYYDDDLFLSAKQLAQEVKLELHNLKSLSMTDKDNKTRQVVANFATGFSIVQARETENGGHQLIWLHEGNSQVYHTYFHQKNLQIETYMDMSDNEPNHHNVETPRKMLQQLNLKDSAIQTLGEIKRLAKCEHVPMTIPLYVGTEIPVHLQQALIGFRLCFVDKQLVVRCLRLALEHLYFRAKQETPTHILIQCANEKRWLVAKTSESTWDYLVADNVTDEDILNRLYQDREHCRLAYQFFIPFWF